MLNLNVLTVVSRCMTLETGARVKVFATIS